MSDQKQLICRLILTETVGKKPVTFDFKANLIGEKACILLKSL
ncbi:hypothetical protein HMPREF0497_2135 [Lentilactobacillus buchneri ATCC 11577]|uniref:Uncharacterized protein n=1 Tax=Lentilactobacillus hilgardii (strain ATCC 8290 / DSM 20176 / CCUG 30140 / JCM 1155 / KCTC 3500 / NBRC 15886 / NCIMB 8040 / NRRL B-1843 / 9) TaxID=1423757 RepID=C0XL27_LENH9|nr:hypothetical protein HMPREF0497_2135 [Lentilactobacillus buchneri ATCC 11577]EEI23772.1 hypothetical protein HMPREF0519_1938 [Lentilactobacillus hilgardii DSM 20176 = ATCC 8290]